VQYVYSLERHQQKVEDKKDCEDVCEGPLPHARALAAPRLSPRPKVKTKRTEGVIHKPLTATYNLQQNEKKRNGF